MKPWNNNYLSFFSNNSTTVSLVVSNWNDIETTKPTNRIEVLSQTLYLTHWYQVGVRQILDLFDSREGCFLPGFPVISRCKKFNLKCNFSQYHCILSAVPLNWNKLLQEVLQSQFVVCSNSRCCLIHFVTNIFGCKINR